MPAPEVPLFQRFMFVLMLCAAGAAPRIGEAQTPPASREALLAQGWGELAKGRADLASATAARILKASPRDHDAVSLGIAAALAGPGVVGALDTYEGWLAASGREDIALLEPIGIGVLRSLADSTEPRIAMAALG